MIKPSLSHRGIGGFALFAGAVYKVMDQSSNIPWIVMFIGVALVISDFSPNKKNKKIREALGEFLLEGQELMARCTIESAEPPTAIAEAWASKVESYLEENLDKSYIARFGDASNLPMAANSIVSMKHRNLWSGIRVRVARLQEFIKELRD